MERKWIRAPKRCEIAPSGRGGVVPLEIPNETERENRFSAEVRASRGGEAGTGIVGGSGVRRRASVARPSVYLGVEPAALAQEGAGDEPEAVADRELVLDEVRLAEAGVRIVPLVGAEARHDEEGEADEHVGREHVEPDLHG